MLAYILRRLLLMIPTIFGIMLVSFAIVQFVPGGPVERAIAQLQGADQSSTAQFGGGGGQIGAGSAQAGGDIASRYRGAQGLDPKFIKELEKQYGFDKPALRAVLDSGARLFDLQFRQELLSRRAGAAADQGEAAGLDLARPVDDADLLCDLDSARRPQGGQGRLALRHVTSALVIFGYAIPSFLFAILLVVLFCGGSFWQIFPLRGLTSDNFADLSWPQKILDYLWHITLPVTALVLGSFATSTLLTKNSFLDEIKKAYVQTARMKGLTERRVLYGHVFRNAMLIVIAGFPGAFIGAFFTGSLLIEQVFSLDGLGYLSYDSLIQRDYPVVLGNLYIFALIGLVVNLISDLTYTWIDPRIDFETREV